MPVFPSLLRASAALLAGAMIFLLGAQDALAQAAARVVFVSGPVSIAGSAGVSRPAQRNAEVNAGDTVTTGADGWAQLRFSDGALTSLQPGTEFRIDEYRFQGTADGSERGFFSLVKGALRTITGAIGHGARRDNYRVTTATATVGIRGTEYLARLDNGLTVSVGNGRVAIVNEGGELVLGPGQTGFARDSRTLPRLVIRKPPVAMPQLRQEPAFLAAERRTGEGQSTALDGHGDNHYSDGPSSGSVFAAGLMNTSGLTDLSAGAHFAGATTADYNLVAVGDALQEFRYFTFNGVIGTASAVETGSIGGLSYGRWTTPGAVASGFNIGAAPDAQATYVFGTATALPTTGSISLLPAGGTSPVNVSGVTGSFSGGSFNIDFSGGTYNFSTLFAVNGASYAIISGPSNLGGGARFSGSNVTGTCTGTGCGAASGLASAWSGLIVNNGNTVGLNYAINDPSGVNQAVIGVQVFTPSGGI
ncbi:MAG: FecR domain-containing protein [Burkholderiales bacterium]|nr:FecR domain-containing protein [Burkholderiales bacterium]